MATTNITFDDKVLGQANALPENKKLTFQNANEIKTVVNNNATELDTTTSLANSTAATVNALDGTNIELIKGGGVTLTQAVSENSNLSLQSVTDNGNLTTNPIVTPSVNGAAITSSGSGNLYLNDSGSYDAVSSDVTSVNGQTGVVVLDGTNIELITGGGVVIDAAITSLESDKVELGGDIGGTITSPTINNNAITNAKLADIPTNRIKGRSTSGNGDVEDLTVPQTKLMLSLDQVDNTSDLNKPMSTAVADALNLIDLDLINLDANITANETAIINNTVAINERIPINVGTTYTTDALATVTQAEYDALTPNATTIYFIV